MSKHLSERQIRGLEKIGMVMFPGDEEFPSFRETRCARHLDRILDYMPAQDLKDLGLLLGLMAALPRSFVKAFLALVESLSAMPGPVGALMRTIRLGLRGLIMSLYYGDPAVHERIGYQVGVYTADQK